MREYGFGWRGGCAVRDFFGEDGVGAGAVVSEEVLGPGLGEGG